MHKKDAVYAEIENLNIFSPKNELTTLGTARCFDIEELSDQPCLRIMTKVLNNCSFSVCCVFSGKGYYANLPLWSQNRVPEVLHQDYPGGRVSALSSAKVRHM